MTDSFTKNEINWVRLVLCVSLTTVGSLSIHIFMLDTLGIPHPTVTTVGPIPNFINEALSAAATIAFYRLAQRVFGQFSIIGRCLLLTAIYAMLNEALLRNFLMDVDVSHDLVYCFVENVAQPLEYFLECCLIVIAAPYLQAGWKIAAGGVVIASAAIFIINPPIIALSDRLIASFEYLDTGNIYNPPYGWQVDIPSYLTFLEPVIASYTIAALILHKLSQRAGWRLLQFAALIMAMKRSIVPTLLFSFYQPLKLPAAVLSESQFALEILVMAILTTLGWQYSRRR